MWSSLWSIRLAISRRSYMMLALAGLVVPLPGWTLLSGFAGLTRRFC